MQYSLEKVVTAADGNTLMARANKEVSDLEFRKLSQTRSHNTYLGRAAEISAEITMVQGELNALNTVLNSLPEGELKDDTFSKKKKLEYRLFTLQEQNENYGALALIEKEMEINMIDKQLEEINAFKAALTAHISNLN